jgi:hypothetical protein
MENASWVFVLLFLVYLYKALRNFYGQGHFITTVKFTLLNTYYAFFGFGGSCDCVDSFFYGYEKLIAVFVECTRSS